jgi:hypothetical protein
MVVAWQQVILRSIALFALPIGKHNQHDFFPPRIVELHECLTILGIILFAIRKKIR